MQVHSSNFRDPTRLGTFFLMVAPVQAHHSHIRLTYFHNHNVCVKGIAAEKYAAFEIKIRFTDSAI